MYQAPLCFLILLVLGIALKDPLVANCGPPEALHAIEEAVLEVPGVATLWVATGDLEVRKPMCVADAALEDDFFLEE